MAINFRSLNVVFLIHAFAFSQTSQIGEVVEINTDGKVKIADTYIKFNGAPNTKSDDNGTFELIFERDIKYGDPLVFEKISKEGFELINLDQLKVLSLSSDGKLNTSIVLGNTRRLDSLEAKIARNLSINYEKKIDNLRIELIDAKLIIEKLQSSLVKNRKQLLDKELNFNLIARQFARTNFDDYSYLEKQLRLSAINGDIEEMINIYEELTSMSEINSIVKEKERNEKISDLYEYNLRKIELRRDKKINEISNLMQIYLDEVNLEKYEEQHKKLNVLGKVDTLGIFTLGVLYYRLNPDLHCVSSDRDYKSYPSKSNHYLLQTIELTKDNDDKVLSDLEMYLMIGANYQSMMNYGQAQQAYEKALQDYLNNKKKYSKGERNVVYPRLMNVYDVYIGLTLTSLANGNTLMAKSYMDESLIHLRKLIGKEYDCHSEYLKYYGTALMVYASEGDNKKIRRLLKSSLNNDKTCSDPLYNMNLYFEYYGCNFENIDSNLERILAIVKSNKSSRLFNNDKNRRDLIDELKKLIISN